MEEGNLAGAPRADDQIFLPVAVEIDPRDARAELRERVREQGLPAGVVEKRIDVGVTAELGADVLK